MKYRRRIGEDAESPKPRETHYRTVLSVSGSRYLIIRLVEICARAGWRSLRLRFVLCGGNFRAYHFRKLCFASPHFINFSPRLLGFGAEPLNEHSRWRDGVMARIDTCQMNTACWEYSQGKIL